MKKLFLFITASILFSCSSDNENPVATNYCNEQVIAYYQDNNQISSNVKNNVVAIEFDYKVSNELISEKLKGLSLFNLPTNDVGIVPIYIDVFSHHSPKFVLAFFKEGNLSCENLNAHINQIENINEVYLVRKVIEGSYKYSILKETSLLKIELNDISDLSNLQNIADQYNYELSEFDPLDRYQEKVDLVYYLIDKSGKKSIIEVAKILSKNISYKQIMPQYIRM